MALGEHLRADQDARLAAVHPVEHGLNRASARGAIPVQPRQRCVGKQARQGLLDAFGALPHGQQRLAAAAANCRHGRVCAAVMTAKLLRATMQSHARIAMRAGGDPAAGVAKQTRRVAAPVQEHDDLAAGLEVLVDRLHGGRRDSLLGGVPAQIDERHSRRLRGTGALRQQVFDIASARGILQSFQRWRCGAQNDGNIGAARPHDGKIARRISKAFVLLVRGIVLFIDTIELSLGSDVNTAERVPMTMRAWPLCAARHASRRFTVGQSGVHHCNAGAETAPKAIDQLRR